MSEQINKQFNIKKIFLKNASFEAPNSPAIFVEEYEPNLNIDLNVESMGLEDDVYYCMLRITATVKAADKVAFLCEVEQAGIFVLQGFTEEELSYMIGSQCPTVLLPYAREAISDLVVKGGFPQLLIEPVNFDAIYANHMQQQQAQAAPQENPEELG